MFILEPPYISDHMLAYASRTGTPVLHTPYTEKAAQRFPLQLLHDTAFAAELHTGKRLYTSSENALGWVYNHCAGSELTRCCDVMKDKIAMRTLLGDMYPDFFFKKISAKELATTKVATLKFPCVIKPSIGFFSLGVRIVANAQEWPIAVAEIIADMQAHARIFPTTVLSGNIFLVEEYIQGEEFAVDLYYDENGEPTILNIFQHRFASTADVSDRLYCTGKAIIEPRLKTFTQFFRQVNTKLNITNIPLHVELRVDRDRIIPIEFNPLRCAGMCCTDLAYYAYGFDTYDYYLNNIKPDFTQILQDRSEWTYSMIILDKRPHIPNTAQLNFAALTNYLQTVLNLRDMTHLSLPLFGIIFARTDTAHDFQLDALLHSDLSEFLQ